METPADRREIRSDGPATRSKSRRRRRPVLTLGFTLLVGSGAVAVAPLAAQGSSQATPPGSARTTAPDADPRAFLDTYCVTCHNQKLRTAGLDARHAGSPPSRAPTRKCWEKSDRASCAPARCRRRECRAPMRPPIAPWRVARKRNRSRVGGQSESRQNRRGPSSQSLGIQQRDSRPVRARHRREAAAPRATRRPTAASTTSRIRSRFRRRIWSDTCRWRARSRGSRPVFLPPSPKLETFEIPLHVLQDDRQSEDLPFGSRGGIAIHYDFPVDGEYLIKVRLQRQYQDYLKGMGWPQQLDVRLDGKLLKRFTVGGAAQRPSRGGQLRRRRRTGLCRRSRMGNVHAAHAATPGWRFAFRSRRVPAWWACRSCERCGSRKASRNRCSGAGSSPMTRCTWATRTSARSRSAVLIKSTGPAKDTPSRRAIFVCQPPRPPRKSGPAPRRFFREWRGCAYRRPVTKADDADAAGVFRKRPAAMAAAFDNGIQFALERMLVDPDFLLRVHPGAGRPAQRSGTDTYRLSDLEVASRLSFFLWSSIPDERLLTLAEHGQLTNPADSGKRSAAHAGRSARHRCAGERFRRAVAESAPGRGSGGRSGPSIPTTTRACCRRSSRKPRCSSPARCARIAASSELLDADYTFVNERLARHYGIPGVYGSRFRRVTLPESRSARRIAGARGRCWRQPLIRTAHRRCCAANGC